jgi:hypothetical protein
VVGEAAEAVTHDNGIADQWAHANLHAMPEPVEPQSLTPREEAKWRAEFEQRGRNAVYSAIYHGGGIYPDRKRELAIK